MYFMPATLILITGRPATGKSCLANTISDALNIPVISKDGFKEILFDEVGGEDRQWSNKLGKASFKLIDYVLEGQLKAGNSIILESPLNPEFENKKFQQWQEKYEFQAIQIICDGDNDVLFERFKQRAIDNNRHIGHQDAESLGEFKEMFQKPVGEQRIDIDATVIQIDTTDFSKVDEDLIIQQINNTTR